MRTTELRVTILKAFKDKEFYGYDVHKKLIAEGIRIEIGRLYNVLNHMLRDGLLESRWEKSAKGPKRRIYRLGIKGKDELDEILMSAIHTIHRAYGEYLLSLPPERSVFNYVAEEVTDHGFGQCKLVLVVKSFSAMYQRLLKSVQDRLVDLKIFVVKSKVLSLKLELDNIVYLEGNLDNIPLKDGYIDILLTTNLPRNENIEKSIKEWCRVIKKTGKVVILAPNILFSSMRDPLTIGDYMEKWEHEICENRKIGEGAVLLDSLQKHFSRVVQKNIVHMKLVIASNLNETKKVVND